MQYLMLVINPGSTSTKIGIYKDEEPLLVETIRHSAEELAPYKDIYSQYPFREKVILETLKEKNFDLSQLQAVIGRGGLLRPMQSGTYPVNEEMIEDLKNAIRGQHASNLGPILAHEIATTYDIPSFIVDPVVVDEMEEVARITGLPEIQRISTFHALNQKAVGKRYAKSIGTSYQDLNLIVTHMGGGISVGAHRKGRVIDVNDALLGEGPFSPERSGGLPMGDLINMCFNGQYSKEEVKKRIAGQGGYVAHLGTNDALKVKLMALDGNQHARLIQEAMAYQIAKEIGKEAAVLAGEVDAILLTGGIAYNEMIVDEVIRRVQFIAPVHVFPGEDELLALAQGGLRVLKGEEIAKIYP